MRVRRYDVGELAPAERLPNGWLRVEGRSARTGVLEYDQPDGSVRRELVTDEVLFEAASLDSARMVPVTNQHPAGLLDADTTRAAQVGSVGELLRQDGDFLVAPLLVTDAATIGDVDAGRRELSWGYDCEVGPPDPALVERWGPHDAVQRRRRYNHLAIVDRARAGAGARLRLDAAGNAVVPVDATAPERQMPEVRIDGVLYTLDNATALQQAVDRAAERARADAAALVEVERKRADRLDAHAKRRGYALGAAQRRLDAMKARMVACDECGGSGKVDGDAPCSYCDGAGSYRMHDALKAMHAPGPEAEHPEEDLHEQVEEVLIDDEALAADPPAPPAEKADAADARKRRAEARADARKRRADSLERIARRRAVARAALLAEAGPHLDGQDAAALDDTAIRRAALARLAPHVDAAALPESGVALLYQAEIARLARARQDGGSASDAVRAGMMFAPRPGGAAPRLDAHEAAAAARRERDAKHQAAFRRADSTPERK